MYSYTEERREKLISELLLKGYSKNHIDVALDEIRLFKPKEFPSEIVRRPKIKIDDILRQNSPQLYILRETLKFMLDKLQRNEFLQIHESNRQIYIEACEAYIQKANETLF